ncbi:ATP-binding cassette domain-containing protein [Streptomyces sp. NPDC090093]|uniref:ATP-binding cassette domain-containing protein n=1 Tax=Streptomyces sp. NPDC090093 TaxID=3365945 RepID=UPI00380DB25B
MNTLDIRGLRVTLPGTARPVLDGVDLHVAAGETVALVGESGSGKSLTSRSALGLLPPGAEVQGAVRVHGRDVLTMNAGELRALRTGTVSMIFQDPRAALNPLRRIGDFLTESVTLTRTMGARRPPHGPSNSSKRSAWTPPRCASTPARSPAACCNAS